jgi:coenzyme F420-reducing hydrogenase alpha subunit
MTAEAGLRVRLALRSGRIAAVAITGMRSALPESLTRGRHADEVQQIIPCLYSLCTHAQGAAAAAALAAARGLGADDATLARRNALVRHEAVLESITRLLLDWPPLHDEAPEVATVAAVRRLQPVDADMATLRIIAGERIYDCDPGRWLADRTLSSFDRWCDEARTLPARLLRRMRDEDASAQCDRLPLLPEVDAAIAAELAARLGAEPGYALKPDWRGEPTETGALARQVRDPLVAAFVGQHGTGATARLLARLVELAGWLNGGSDSQPPVRQLQLDEVTGIGLVETSRGLLLHRAVVRDGRVWDYRILAPTEWNFHPGGALVRGLRGRIAPDADSARMQAQRLAQSLDPCVALTVEVDGEAETAVEPVTEPAPVVAASHA